MGILEIPEIGFYVPLSREFVCSDGFGVAELKRRGYYFGGELPEWPMGTDCKSVGDAFAGSNPALPTSSIGNQS